MTLAAPTYGFAHYGRQATDAVALATMRLTVRPMGREDVPRIYETNRSLNERYLTAPALDLASLDELCERFELEWKVFGLGYLMVFHLADETPVGHVRLKWIPDCASGRAAELTFAISPEFQGRGYATEAVAAVTRFAFLESRLDYVVCCVEPENAASIRVAEKNGMVMVAAGRVHHRHMRRYLLPASMWKAQQRALKLAAEDS